VRFSVLSRTLGPVQDDLLLVEAFRGGDRSAFETLYQRHVRSIYRFVYLRTHHRPTAEDIVSQTFLQALQRIDSFDAARGSFTAWIYRIARNLIIDHYRKLRPESAIEDAWDLPAGSDTAADADAAIRIQQARSLLKDLNPKQREIVLLRAWEGRPFAEIAEIVGSTEAAAKMTYRRSVEALKNALLVLLLFSLHFTA